MQGKQGKDGKKPASATRDHGFPLGSEKLCSCVKMAS